jgi:hypothetical protein
VPKSSRELVGDAQTWFDGEVERICELVDRQQDIGAASRIQRAGVAAHYAHTGHFSSSHLEQALETIGIRSVAVEHTPDRPSETKRILHVLTRAEAIRGTSRMVWRWISQDPTDRSYSVALTDQTSVIPELLTTAVERNGGQLYDLHKLAARGGVLNRAAALRQVARDYDAVVLHIDPADITPSLAFAGRIGDPTVMMYNQMDHTFWFGAGVSDSVANGRAHAETLCLERRGIAAERLLRLPLIIDSSTRTRTRAEAKAALGFSPNTRVLLTAAVGYKFATASKPTFFDLVTKVVRENSDVVLLACGPNATPAWREAASQTDGRIQALGPQVDMRTFHEAADIYVDSMPFGSTTSCLDAALYETPVVSFRPVGDIVLTSTTPGLDHGACIVRTAEDGQVVLNDLLTDETRRLALGEKTAQAVRDVHVGDAWFERLDSLFEQTRGLPQATASDIREIAAECTPLDERIADMHEAGGLSAKARGEASTTISPFSSLRIDTA